MSAGKWKSETGVIDICIQPCRRCVTLFAIGRESHLCMGRAVGGLKVLEMTSDASRGSARKNSIGMTCIALQCRVSTIQRKMREEIVIELRSSPAVGLHRMAYGAI